MNLEIFNAIPATIWVAFFALVGTVIASLINVYSKRGTAAVENASELTVTAMLLVKEQKEINSNLEARLSMLEKNNSRLRDRNITLENRVNTVERDNTALRGRIRSLEENEKANQQHMLEMENQINEWSKGIKILIEQIKRHDSRPDWTPYGDKG